MPCALFVEIFNDDRAVKELRPLPRRGVELGIFGGGVGAVIEQYFHDLELAGGGREVQRGLARCTHGSAELYETDHEFPAAVRGGLVDELGRWLLAIELIEHARVAVDDAFDSGSSATVVFCQRQRSRSSAISAPW